AVHPPPYRPCRPRRRGDERELENIGRLRIPSARNPRKDRAGDRRRDDDCSSEAMRKARDDERDELDAGDCGERDAETQSTDVPVVRVSEQRPPRLGDEERSGGKTESAEE